MNPYTHEDVMWQRLKDLQRETDNRRLIRAESKPVGGGLVRVLAARAWLLAGLAMRRPPRRTPPRQDWTAGSEGDAASRVA